MTSVLSAIGLPVCLSRAPRPTGPPASRPASKGHSSVKRLRKMSVKGSLGSHTLSSPAKLPSRSCSLDSLLCPLWLFSSAPLPPPCLPPEVAAGLLPSRHCWVTGLSLRTHNFAMFAADCDTTVSSGGLTDLEPSCCHLPSIGVAGMCHHAQFM